MNNLKVRRIVGIFAVYMRRIIGKYIYENKDWPGFSWDNDRVLPLLTKVRYKQGRLKGYMEMLGLSVQDETNLLCLTNDVLKSSEIEGEILNRDQVRSSVARQLGLKVAGMVVSDRNVDGVVEMMLDATRNHDQKLTKDRLFGWHSLLFPTGKSGMHKIRVGSWRKDDNGPMQVVSGALGKERIHFEAPEASSVNQEMKVFLQWFNTSGFMDAVLNSAIAHLWFLTIHPFADGNGRIARALSDLLLARSDRDAQRFYSMSSQIRIERNAYYEALEKAQKGDLDITDWIIWYLNCLDRALDTTDKRLQNVLRKTKFWDAHASIAINERQRLMINKLFDGFEGKLTTSKWAKMTKCSADTALRDIQDLMQKEILRKEDAGGRSTSYLLIAETSKG